MSLSTIEKPEKMQYRDKTEKQTVENFYERGNVSREIPIKRTLNKDQIIKKAIEGSLRHSSDTFKEENPDISISYSKFVKLKPSNVLPMTKNKYLQCLCKYCMNIEFQVKSLARFGISKQSECPAIKYEISRITLCEKENGFYKRQCLDRKCNECGIRLFEEKVQPSIEKNGDKEVACKKWKDTEKIEISNGKEVKKCFMELKCQTGTLKQLVEEIKTDLVPLSQDICSMQVGR